MSNPIQIRCPQCHQILNIRPEYAGKRAACKHCEAVFTIVLPSEASEGAPGSVDRSEAHKAELDQARNEIQALRAKLATQQETLRSQAAALQAELEARIHLLESESTQKEENWVRFVKSHDDLKAELQSSEARFAELQAAYEQSRSEQTETAENWVRFVKSHDDLKAELQSSEVRFTELQAAYEQSRSEQTETAENWVRFVKSHDDLKAQLQASEERAGNLQSALERSQAEVDDLKARLEGVLKGQDESADATKRLANDFEELKNRHEEEERQHLEAAHHWGLEKAAHEKERDDLLGKIVESSSPLAAKEEEIARLREELAAFPALVEELNQKLESARSSEHLAKSHLYQLGIRLPQ